MSRRSPPLQEGRNLQFHATSAVLVPILALAISGGAQQRVGLIDTRRFGTQLAAGAIRARRPVNYIGASSARFLYPSCIR